MGTVRRGSQQFVSERRVDRDWPEIRKIGRSGRTALAGSAQRRVAGQIGSEGAHGGEPQCLRLQTGRLRSRSHRKAGDWREQLLLAPRSCDGQVDERATARCLKENIISEIFATQTTSIRKAI